MSKPLLPGVDEVERFAGRDFVEIGGADFVEERVLVVAEERELPRGAAGGHWVTGE